MKSYLGCSTRILTEEEAKLLLECLMLEKRCPKLTPAPNHDSYKVMDMRLQQAGVRDKISDCVILFCSSISENWADAIMWAYTLFVLSEKFPVTMDTWCFSFPSGIPKDEEKTIVWKNPNEISEGAGFFT